MKEVASWFSLDIPPERQMYWGIGATLLLLCSSIMMNKFEKARIRNRVSRLYPITNDNIPVCREILIIYVEKHINYLAGFLDTLEDTYDHSGVRKLYMEFHTAADTFRGVLKKLKSVEVLTDDELTILNELLIKKNIVILYGETEVL
ncbi:hypothetical protein [Paenibacillus taichungensis]